DMTTWHYQWKELWKDYRVALFDQRGHGRSGNAMGGDHTLQAMGRDMKAVIDAAVPEGRPVVVLGHSMGGMAVLGLAETHPELFGPGGFEGVAGPEAQGSDEGGRRTPRSGRIVGAVFADTAAAELVRGAAGAIGTRLLALAPTLGRRFGERLGKAERARARVARSDLAYLVARLTNFGPGASPSMVEYVVDL